MKEKEKDTTQVIKTEPKSEEEIKELLKVAHYCPRRQGCSWDYTPKK